MSFIGKHVGDNTYIHLSQVESLHIQFQELIAKALNLLPLEDKELPNVAKVGTKSLKVSLLEYLQFEEDPFPVLNSSWTLSSPSSEILNFRSYKFSLNPPILHRKELLVSKSHPKFSEWSRMTVTCESIGLFDQSKTIGFSQNWIQAIREKGFQLIGTDFYPIGNELSNEVIPQDREFNQQSIPRHLTALSRQNFSAPVQMLMKYGLINKDELFFDYGCGRGDDVASLKAESYFADGWDPFYRPSVQLPIKARCVNLGFVVNVIEEPAERVKAIVQAFEITEGVMSVGVMLQSPDRRGRPYGDGLISSRGTFQKYFTQDEFKDYLENILNLEIFLVAPGIAFIFKDKLLEQAFLTAKYRTNSLEQRLKLLSSKFELKPERLTRVPSSEYKLYEEIKPFLDLYWNASLSLGRFPDAEEFSYESKSVNKIPSRRVLIGFIEANYPIELLSKARLSRADDLKLYFALQNFSKRPKYHQLERRLQKDIKEFFGDYSTAQASGLNLLSNLINTTQLQAECVRAAELGLGEYEEGFSLQLHVDLIDRLPVLLRAYVACAIVLTNGISTAKLVKIHIHSGKLTLMEFDNFDESPLPLMSRRIKINLKKLTYDLFEYGDEYEKPILYFKSRFLNEDIPNYAQQLAFDESIESLCILGDEKYGPSAKEFSSLISSARLEIRGWELLPSTSLPDIDSPCGINFTYRDFIECGETQLRLKLANIPRRSETYNALYGLATTILDPLIEYFGAIKLTYGFCSHELSKQIKKRVAPAIDQHSSEEYSPKGIPICERGGAACDFIIEDEDMREVAIWIQTNLDYDRIYFYGSNRPLHISWSRTPSFKSYEMVLTKTGRLMPKQFK